jgi:hypothetical protein
MQIALTALLSLVPALRLNRPKNLVSNVRSWPRKCLRKNGAVRVPNTPMDEPQSANMKAIITLV